MVAAAVVRCWIVGAVPVVVGIPVRAVPAIRVPPAIVWVAPTVAVVWVRITPAPPNTTPTPREPDPETPSSIGRVTAVVRDVCASTGGRRRSHIPDIVLEQVVVEVPTTGHLACEVGQVGFLVGSDPPNVWQPVVPVISAHELAEVERVARVSGVHGANTTRTVHPDGLAIAPAQDLELLSGAHIVVVHWIEWEKDPDTAVWLGMQNEHEPVHVGAGFNANAISETGVRLVEPDLDGGIHLLQHFAASGDVHWSESWDQQ